MHVKAGKPRFRTARACSVPAPMSGVRHRAQEAKDIAADLKAFLSDFHDAIALEEKDTERVFAGRAATALTAALALGIVIGWALRRKP